MLKYARSSIFISAMLLITLLMMYGCLSQPSEQKNVSENVTKEIKVEERVYYGLNIYYYGESPVFVGDEVKLTIQVVASKSTIAPIMILYGKKSVAFPSSTADYEFSTPPFELNAPGIITRTLTFDEPGIYYVRAYTFIDKPYWSDEIRIEVKEKEKVEESNMTVIINNEGPNINQINFKLGETLKLLLISNASDILEISYPEGKVFLSPNEKRVIEMKFIRLSIIQIFRKGEKIGEIRIVPS